MTWLKYLCFVQPAINKNMYDFSQISHSTTLGEEGKRESCTRRSEIIKFGQLFSNRCSSISILLVLQKSATRLCLAGFGYRVFWLRRFSLDGEPLVPVFTAPPAAEARQTSFEEDASESAPEVLVENGVDDWVQRGVHVAQPEDEGEGARRDDTRLTDRYQDIEEEEGEPACDEGAHDEPKDECRALFLLPRQTPLFPLRIFWLHYPWHLFSLYNVQLLHFTEVDGLALRFRGFSTEYGFTEPKFERFDNGTSTNYTAVRTRWIKLTDHIRVNGEARRATSERLLLLLQVTVDTKGGRAELGTAQRGA